MWSLLRGELGAVGAATLVGRVARAMAHDPFATLGAPKDRRDQLSRRQLAPLLCLYRELSLVRGSDAALELCRRVTLEAGKHFLARMIRLPAQDALASDAAQQMVDGFFNAEGEVEIEGRSLCFTVTRCRFVELLHAVDAPELAPLLCQVDQAYFANPLVPIRLERTTTLARGQQQCDFRFEERESSKRK